jgi:molybdenum cofactor biosynthesis enzyme MoaA
MKTQLIKAQYSLYPDMMSLNISLPEIEEIIKKEITQQVAKEIINNIDLVIEDDPFNAGVQKVNVNVIVIDPIDYNSMVTELERLRRKDIFKF